jgi:hypothetical protein
VTRLLLGVLVWVMLLTWADVPGVMAQAPELRGIRAADTRIEIEVWSPDPFPVRALSPVLRIGQREFTLSRHPDGGDLHTLIFILTVEEFGRVSSGEDVTVHYGSPGHAWAFGRLDKSRVSR